MTLTATGRRTVFSLAAPSTPRLHLQPARSANTLLDGGWWPRSTDPMAELPGLVMAIDALHGPHVGYFASQPTSLLTALSGTSGDRVDLLIVPPDTDSRAAAAAMTLAAAPGNQIHARDILQTIHTPHLSAIDDLPEHTWEGEGGRLASRLTSAANR